jgi:hypothetical protein
MRREAGIELASGVVSHSVESLQEDKSRLHSRLKDFTSQQPVAPSPAETPAPTKLLRRQDAAELFGEKPISPTPEAAAAAPSRHPLLDD